MFNRMNKSSAYINIFIVRCVDKNKIEFDDHLLDRVLW